MFNENEKEDQDFFKPTEDGFDVNWNDKVDENLAAEVIDDGVLVRKFEDTSSTWWSHYKLNNKNYVGLCDFNDIWEVDEELISQY